MIVAMIGVVDYLSESPAMIPITRATRDFVGTDRSILMCILAIGACSVPSTIAFLPFDLVTNPDATAALITFAWVFSRDRHCFLLSLFDLTILYLIRLGLSTKIDKGNHLVKRKTPLEFSNHFKAFKATG
jgi:hypothetical protein